MTNLLDRQLAAIIYPFSRVGVSLCVGAAETLHTNPKSLWKMLL